MKSLTNKGKLLIIRTDEIGDMVLMSPLLREIRRALPKWEITLLTSNNAAVFNLFETCPYIDTLLQEPTVPEGRLRRPRSIVPTLAFAFSTLRKTCFDLILCPRAAPEKFQTLFLTSLARGKEKIGSKAAVGNSFFAQKVFSKWAFPEENLHSVQNNLNYLTLLGLEAENDRLELWVTAEDRQAAKKLLASCKNPCVAIAPGAKTHRKRWPGQNFALVAKEIFKKHPVDFIILGDRSEYDLCQNLKEMLGNQALNLAGSTSLRESAAVLEMCQLLVSNDSAPMHLAAAMGTAVVAVGAFPSTAQFESPEKFHPWKAPYTFFCPESTQPPCENACRAPAPHCILEIGVTPVLAACLFFLDRPGKKDVHGIVNISSLKR